MGNKCSAPGREGFVCPHTISSFPSTSNGTALEDAEAIIEADPDVAGIGVLVAFSLAFMFSSLLAFVIHFAEASEIHKMNKNLHSKRKKHAVLKRTHHILDRILVGWSDQQLVLGLATSLAVLALWCSFSTYHLNLIKQWLVFCSVTHVNALLVHCDYFNKNHTLANSLRFGLITLHTVLAIVVLFFNGQTTSEWGPTIGDNTPLQALPAPCFFENATRSDSLEEVIGWKGNGLDAKWLFIVSTIMVVLALVALVVDFFHRTIRKGWWGWYWRLVFLIGNAVIGIMVFAYTLRLRGYMVEFKWLEDDKESKITYGQFVPILLAILVLFSACQSISDEIPDREPPNQKQFDPLSDQEGSYRMGQYPGR